MAIWGGNVRDRCNLEGFFARGLDKPAISALGTATGADLPINTRGIVRPDDDPAAVTASGGIGIDNGIRADKGCFRISYGPLSLKVAAD